MFVCACKFALFDKSTLCDGTDNITKEVGEPDVRVKIKRISPKCVLFQHFYSENLLKYYQSVSYCNTKISWSCYNSHFFLLSYQLTWNHAVFFVFARVCHLPLLRLRLQMILCLFLRSVGKVIFEFAMHAFSSARAPRVQKIHVEKTINTHTKYGTPIRIESVNVWETERAQQYVEGVRAKRVNRRNMALLQHYKPWIWK